MLERFFELSDKVDIPGRWELGHLLDRQGRPLDDPWRFTVGKPVSDLTRATIPVEINGNPLDFSHAAFSTPIIHSRLAALFAHLAPDDVQLLPVTIGGRQDEYLVLNALRLVECIDDQASAEVRYWRPEDGLPEKVGTYFSIHGMRIDPARVGSARVFRTRGWESLIVSESIKSALEGMGATGTDFTEVTGPHLAAWPPGGL